MSVWSDGGQSAPLPHLRRGVRSLGEVESRYGCFFHRRGWNQMRLLVARTECRFLTFIGRVRFAVHALKNACHNTRLEGLAGYYRHHDVTEVTARIGGVDLAIAALTTWPSSDMN